MNDGHSVARFLRSSDRLTGNWPVVLLSVLSGIILSLPWIFERAGWALLVALIPLLVADQVYSSSKFSFFSRAFLAFSVWNILSTWWIGYVSVGGVLMISVLNSLLMAFVWWLGNYLGRKTFEGARYFVIIIVWLAFEYFHNHWELQWPWLTLGNGLSGSVKIIQWYEFTGVLGGSLWIMLINVLGFSVIKSFHNRLFRKGIVKFLLLTSSVILPVFLSGKLYSDYKFSGNSLEILIVQPNVDPYTQKFRDGSGEEQLSSFLIQAKTNVSQSTDIILGPETVLPAFWEDSVPGNSNKKLYSLITDFPRVTFISGALTKRKIAAKECISEATQYDLEGNYYYEVYNSAVAFGLQERIQIGHKNILVNGVEKMPFQKYFGFLKRWLLDLGGTVTSLSPGKFGNLFVLNDTVRIAPVICFESVFGDYVRAQIKKGAEFLVVLTNDGWWKDSPGVWQHFNYSRIRAIENRRFVARSANTGLSGVIDEKGEIVSRTGVNTVEVIYSSVLTNQKITFYTLYGNLIGKFCLGLTVLMIVFVWLTAENRFWK